MKQIIILLFFAAFFSTHVAYSQKTLSGKIIDKTTGETLIGATIYVPDLKTGVSSDANGNYILKDLPAKKFMVQVKYVGYSTILELIDLATVSGRDFSLSVAIVESPEVVVTGNAVASENKGSSVSVTVMERKELQSIPSTNIIDAIAHTPGVSQITTGGAISKPVIRGLGYNRIVVLSEGLKQEGQQWGDEHGIEIDENSVEKVEVLRGPSSLLYGSDAIGGVINFLEPLPPLQGKIAGEMTTKYFINEKLFGQNISLEGNRNGYSAILRGTYKNSASYHTPQETVYNSAFNELNFSGMVGVNKKWGYSHLHFSSFHNNIGIIEADRDSATQKFIDLDGKIVPDNQLESRSLLLPFQNVRHKKVSSVNRFIIGNNQLSVIAGKQQNEREEFVDSKNIPGLHLLLNTISTDVKYYLEEKNGWSPIFGISGMSQENKNTGIEFLIPDYTLKDAGGLFYLKKKTEKLTFNTGIRYDFRTEAGKEKFIDTLKLFSPFEKNYSAVSGAIGGTWSISEIFNLKLNAGRGFRAPNISELSANGVHEGTFRYEIGNTNLKPETSLQFDAGITAETERAHVELNLFRNTIHDFIYYRNSNSETILLPDSTAYPVYRYTQGDALLQGFELVFDIHLLKHMHFENSFSFVHAENISRNIALPLVPAPLIHNELRWDIKVKSGFLKNPFIKLNVDNHLTQNRFDKEFETATMGYSIFNFEAGTEFRIMKQFATFSISVNNIADNKYYDHLNRLKYKGVYNKGRNINFAITIPFSLKT